MWFSLPGISFFWCHTRTEPRGLVIVREYHDANTTFFQSNISMLKTVLFGAVPVSETMIEKVTCRGQPNASEAGLSRIGAVSVTAINDY